MSYSNEVLTQIQAQHAEINKLYEAAVALLGADAINAKLKASFDALAATATANINAQAKAQTAAALNALQATAASEAATYLAANKADITAAAAAKVDTAALAAQEVAKINEQIKSQLKAAIAAALNTSDITAYAAQLKAEARATADALAASLKTTLADATTDINAKRREVRDFDIAALANAELQNTLPNKLDRFFEAQGANIVNSNAVKAAASAFLNTDEIKTAIKDDVAQNILLSDFKPQVDAALATAAQTAAENVFELPELKRARFLHALYMKLFALQQKQAHLVWWWEAFMSEANWWHKIFKHR